MLYLYFLPHEIVHLLTFDNDNPVVDDALVRLLRLNRADRSIPDTLCAVFLVHKCKAPVYPVIDILLLSVKVKGDAVRTAPARLFSLSGTALPEQGKIVRKTLLEFFGREIALPHLVIALLVSFVQSGIDILHQVAHPVKPRLGLHLCAECISLVVSAPGMIHIPRGDTHTGIFGSNVIIIQILVLADVVICHQKFHKEEIVFPYIQIKFVSQMGIYFRH